MDKGLKASCETIFNSTCNIKSFKIVAVCSKESKGNGLLRLSLMMIVV